MKIHFIIHEAFEGPGAFLTWANERNYTVSSSKVYLEESLPIDSESIDILVVLGGPQCPDTKQEECHYFSAKEEVAFILSCIESNKAVVGVCLGAQLIGEALGARFEKSPYKEIGYFPIELTMHAAESQKFSHFKDCELVGHWHNDMPGLTQTSKVLATSEGCPRQIVEYSSRVYGFQCHLEFTLESITELIDVSIDEFNDIENQNYQQSPEYILAQSSVPMNSLLYKFMDKLVDEYAFKRK